MKAALVLSTAIGAAMGFAPARPTARAPTSMAFFGGVTKGDAAKASPLAAEAIEVFNKKYKPESIFARSPDVLASAFNTIASLYGEENALRMVKIEPVVLGFDKDNFGPSLDAFGEKFGLEESKEMIMRNPGLLSVTPEGAEKADDLTMQLSYVVEFTRPIGIFGPIIIVALLSVPAIESATGVSRGELFNSLF